MLIIDAQAVVPPECRCHSHLTVTMYFVRRFSIVSALTLCCVVRLLLSIASNNNHGNNHSYSNSHSNSQSRSHISSPYVLMSSSVKPSAILLTTAVFPLNRYAPVQRLYFTAVIAIATAIANACTALYTSSIKPSKIVC